MIFLRKRKRNRTMLIEGLTFYKMSSGSEEPTSKEQTERPITTKDAKQTTTPTEPPVPTASTAKPTTAAPITDPQRNILECGTAIVGAGEIWIPPFRVKLFKGSLLLSILNV